MVVSRSGKHSHLVQPKRKSGGLMCDENISQQNNVATAEYDKQLDQLVASYNSVKEKTTCSHWEENWTQLAGNKIPHGTGSTDFALNIYSLSTINKCIFICNSGWIFIISRCVFLISTSFPTMPPATAFSPSASSYAPPFCHHLACILILPLLLRTVDLIQPMGVLIHFVCSFITGNTSVCHGRKGRYDKKIGPLSNICLAGWRMAYIHTSEKQSFWQCILSL